MDTRQINLLDLIGRDIKLKKAAGTGGGEWHGPCPFCGGIDRFAVQPNGRGWSCRQCTPHWQDAIAYVMRRDGVGFKQAVETLGLPLDQQPRSAITHPPHLTPEQPQPLNTYLALTDEVWKNAARGFCARSFDELWGKDGLKALEYLKKRGISEAVIEEAGLGYNSHDEYAKWGETDVFMPRGIVIPWVIDKAIWKVNIRRPEGEPKYLQITGGANGLYNADSLRSDEYVYLTEGEFDSLVLRSHCKGIKAVATGTTSGARVLRWVSLLSMAYRVVIAYDADETTNEGVQKAVQWWSDNLKNAVRTMPTAHDITDMWKAGIDLQTWLDDNTLGSAMPVTTEMEERRQAFREQVFSEWRALAA